MYKIENITSDPAQAFTLVLPGRSDTAKLTLYYIERLMSWYMDLEYEDKTIRSRRVCSSPNLLRQWYKTMPFGLACYTLDNTDPFTAEDFEAGGRCGLIVLSEDEAFGYEEYLTELKDAQI